MVLSCDVLHEVQNSRLKNMQGSIFFNRASSFALRQNVVNMEPTGVLPAFSPLKKAGASSGFEGGRISIIPGTRCLPHGKLGVENRAGRTVFLQLPQPGCYAEADIVHTGDGPLFLSIRTLAPECSRRIAAAANDAFMVLIRCRRSGRVGLSACR